MENKNINVSFGLVVITFLVIFFILIKDFNSRRLHDFKDYSSTMVNIIQVKNYKIRSLERTLTMVMKENQDLKNTLSQTRNDLDLISKKLAQQAAPAPAASVPAPAATK